MVIQLASSSSVQRRIKQLSRWVMACALGTAVVGAPLAGAAPPAKHHRKTAATAHAAARPKHVAYIRRTTVTTRTTVRVIEPASQSVGYAAGLHATEDPLFLRSGAAIVLDQDTKE